MDMCSYGCEGKENRNDLHLFQELSPVHRLNWQHSESTIHAPPSGVHCLFAMVVSRNVKGGLLGVVVGRTVGVFVGLSVGTALGASVVGATLGVFVGLPVGADCLVGC
jgi:hypothetical protein